MIIAVIYTSLKKKKKKNRAWTGFESGAMLYQLSYQAGAGQFVNL